RMTFDELLAEGEALTRPSWILRTEPTDSGVVGFWGGERSDIPDALPPKVTAFRGRRHILTLSESLLAGIDVRNGPVSLFELGSVKPCLPSRVGWDYGLRFKALSARGESFYATPDRRFPPSPAFVLWGRKKRSDRRRERDRNRHDYWQVSD